MFAPELEKFGERFGVLHVELAGACAAQRRQMRAATERLADVVAERADVGALGAGDTEVNVRQIQLQQPQIVLVQQVEELFI